METYKTKVQKTPMTRLVNNIIENYFKNRDNNKAVAVK